jgi:predicted amidophosphoribosyltransferase
MHVLENPYAVSDALHLTFFLLFTAAIALLYNFTVRMFLKRYKLEQISNMGIVFASIMISYFSLIIYQNFHFGSSHIKAPAYVWPKGCEQRYYQAMDQISRTCGPDTYQIKNYRSLGLTDQSGRNIHTSYFRVNNDAIQIKCYDRLENDCVVVAIYRNVYHQ